MSMPIEIEATDFGVGSIFFIMHGAYVFRASSELGLFIYYEYID